MTIKMKLLISNILMLFVPAVLIVSVAVGLLVLFAQIYGTEMNTIKGMDASLAEVESMIEGYIEESDNKEDLAEELVVILGETLKEKGYNLYVTKNGQEFYTSNTSEENMYLEYFLGVAKDASGKIALISDFGSVFSNTYRVNGDKYEITCIYLNEQFNTNNLRASVSMFINNYVWLVFFAALFIIIITNGILTAFVYKCITKRLKILGAGVHEISEGNLDYKIEYAYKDEFTEICHEFNQMGKKLDESEGSRLKEEKSRKDLIAGISHDLRTPLTVIKAYIEGLRDGVAVNADMEKRYLNIVHEKTCDIDNMVDRLFLFSKIDTGKFPFYNEKAEVTQVIQLFINSVKDEFMEKNLEIRVMASTNGVYAMVDKVQLRQVLYNIVDNSCKYRVCDKVAMEIFISVAGENVEIILKDDGKGVPSECLNDIFDTFYRGDTSRENPGSGSGLGLAISKIIIKNFGGDIYARNETDGFSIIITLPVLK